MKKQHMDEKASGNNMTSLATYTFVVGDLPYRIKAKVIFCGKDLVVICGGGTKYHVGAVSVAVSTTKLKDRTKSEATSSTIGIPGHKEDQIAREAALRLSTVFGVTAIVSVGIHITNASSDDIKKLIENFQKLLEQIIETLTNLGVSNGGNHIQLIS
jgi:hypothetical protein